MTNPSVYSLAIAAVTDDAVFVSRTPLLFVGRLLYRCTPQGIPKKKLHGLERPIRSDLCDQPVIITAWCSVRESHRQLIVYRISSQPEGTLVSRVLASNRWFRYHPV